MEHLETKSCHCQSNVIPNTYDRHAGVAALLLGWPLGLPRLKHLLCLKWQQLAAVDVRGGKQSEGRQRVRREETRASCRGPEWEEERWRARRSGIIRSLCGPLKRLRRKPADGTSALAHLGKGHIRDIHSIELCHTCGMVKWAKQRKMTNRRNKWLESN